MVRLLVSGATGKMGQAVMRVAATDAAVTVAAVTDREESGYLNKAPQELSPNLASTCILADDLSLLKDKIDLFIDFTRPAATLGYLEQAMQLGVAMVIGTTGFNEAEIAKIRETAEKIPLLLAPNMSLGMNLLFAFSGKLATALGEDFDIDILEVHHRHKEDAPSGSAKEIGRRIMAAKEQPLREFSMQAEGVRPRDGSLRFQSVRSGGVVGEHRVIFGSEYERVEFAHSALSRDVFAQGAIRAAKWLAGQDAGFYTMLDLLGVGS